MATATEHNNIFNNNNNNSQQLKPKRSQRFTVPAPIPSTSPPVPPLPSNTPSGYSTTSTNSGTGTTYDSSVSSQSVPPPPQSAALGGMFSQSTTAASIMNSLNRGVGSGYEGGIPTISGTAAGFHHAHALGGATGHGRKDSFPSSEDSNPYSQSPTGSDNYGAFGIHSQASGGGGGTQGSSFYSPQHLSGSVGGGGGNYFPASSQGYHGGLNLGGASNGSAFTTPASSMKVRGSASGLRSALPEGWVGGFAPGQGQGGGSGFLAGGGGGMMSLQNVEDDVIPTAVVVKNIPFNVKKEQLLAIFDDLQIAAPYAFNYHFDDGVFRGLAFANFRTPNETDAAVAALNGYELQGRKLRVEYKKVLKEGEKERIEREKALKRMRSAVLASQASSGNLGQSAASASGLGSGFPGDDGTPYRRTRDASSASGYGDEVITGQFSGLMLGGGNNGASGEPLAVRRDSAPVGGSGRSLPIPTTTSGGNGLPTTVLSEDASDKASNSKYELDMNDPQTLELYSRVLLFKEDNFRDELSFSRNLSTSQRRTVHLLAQKLDLDHKSVGNGDDRHVVVIKKGSGKNSNSSLSPESAYPPATLARLQAKKSMPDMRPSNSYYSNHSSPQPNSTSSYNNNFSPLSGRKSNSNLQERYFATVGTLKGGSARPSVQGIFAEESGFSVPPVPQLPTGINVEGGNLKFPKSSDRRAEFFDEPNSSNDIGNYGIGGTTKVLRQPKGPSDTGGRSWGRAQGAAFAQALAGGGEGENIQTTENLEF